MKLVDTNRKGARVQGSCYSMDEIERMDFGTFVWLPVRRGIRRDLVYMVGSRVDSVMSCRQKKGVEDKDGPRMYLTLPSVFSPAGGIHEIHSDIFEPAFRPFDSLSMKFDESTPFHFETNDCDLGWPGI